MQGSLWISLLRRIPPAMHDQLILTPLAGSEIMVTKLIHFDENFLIFRGRLAGTTDAGRIIMLPYEQMLSVAFNRPLPEAEIDKIFGTASATETAEKPSEQPEVAAEPAAPEVQAGAPPPEAAPPPPVTSPAPPASST